LQLRRELIFQATGEAEFEPAECSTRKKVAHLIDPLSVSVTAERMTSDVEELLIRHQPNTAR
jgi:hypothetical protein